MRGASLRELHTGPALVHLDPAAIKRQFPAWRCIRPGPIPNPLYAWNRTYAAGFELHHRSVPWPLSVMRTSVALPPSSNGKERAMQQQRRFNPTAPPLDQRLIEEAQRLRKEARGTHPGIERERLIRRARQAETGAHISQWLASSGLTPR